jgi:tellurite resistance protein TehA-like permease
MKSNLEILKDATRNLHPAYFAMIMATGIVSIAFKAMGYERIAEGLFVLNIISYLLLLPLLAGRVLFFWPQVMADMKTPRRAWPFLTFSVGTNTVGAQLILFLHAVVPALLLWVLAAASWACCIYFILFNIVTRQEKSIADIVDGATLLIIVSTESIALLGVRLLEALSIQSGSMLFMVWMFWATGFALYFLIMPLVMHRMFFYPMEPKDWHGPYWVCMGAVAIITLTGAEMVLHIPDGPLWEDVHGTTKALTLVSWAIATWWIPYQIVMDVWKLTRVRISGAAPLWIRCFPWARLAFGRNDNHFFEPPSWGRVFPMGMYAACTLSLAKATGFRFLEVVPQYWGWCALAIWAMTFAGTMRVMLGTFFQENQK